MEKLGGVAWVMIENINENKIKLNLNIKIKFPSWPSYLFDCEARTESDGRSNLKSDGR